MFVLLDHFCFPLMTAGKTVTVLFLQISVDISFVLEALIFKNEASHYWIKWSITELWPPSDSVRRDTITMCLPSKMLRQSSVYKENKEGTKHNPVAWRWKTAVHRQHTIHHVKWILARGKEKSSFLHNVWYSYGTLLVAKDANRN